MGDEIPPSEVHTSASRLGAGAKKVRVKKFAAAIVAGKNQAEAARIAGVPPRSAPQAGHRLAQSPEVQSEIKRLLTKAGLGDDRIVSELKEGLATTKFGKYDRLDVVDRIIKLNGHDKTVTNNSIVNVGKDSFLEFCRAYHQSKQEAMGNENNSSD